MRVTNEPRPAHTTSRPRRTRFLCAIVAPLLAASLVASGAGPAFAAMRDEPDGVARAAQAERASGVSAGGASEVSAGGALESTATTQAAVPTTAAVAAATSWLKHRRGVVGYATIDSGGKMYGYHVDQRFVTASVVKAMLLVAYLRHNPKPGRWAIRTLTNMIHVSDNDAATAIYRKVGDKGLREVARAAGMTRFWVGGGTWGKAQLTPADQARFFLRMDSLLPSRDVGFARGLLSHISSAQSWGIPAVARPAGWTVFFKGGWRTTNRGQLVHQASRLESHGTTISIAVMTDGDPTMGYGIATIRGVTQRLLGIAR